MCLSAGFASSGMVDIELGSGIKLTPVPTPLPAFKKDPQKNPARSVGVPLSHATPSASPAVPNVSTLPTQVVVQGVFKMKDLYQSGMRAYKEQDYEKALRYFKRALDIHDPYTSKYYYAETHSMLGVIYQFYYPVPGHLETAKAEYEAALQIDPKTKSARKHLAEVSLKDKP
jgi:tetratricopeptide (TPR) repeat protein